MNACPDKTILLQGLLDSELDAVNAAAFETHLKGCETCHAEYLRLLALREAITAPMVTYRAPDRLRAEIERMVRAESAPAPSANSVRDMRSARRIAPWAASGVVGSLLAASLAAVLVAPQITESGMERQLVASHVRSLLANHLTDVATSNQHVVRPWFNGKVDIAPPVPELADQGFPLVGGRLDYIDGRVVPAIVYKRRLHTVNLFVWPAGQVVSPSHTDRLDGYSLVEWTQGGLRFAAVSDIDAQDLQKFRQAFRQHAPN